MKTLASFITFSSLPLAAALITTPASAAVFQSLSNLYNFNGINGIVPNGPLTLGSNGLLYGTTSGGGMNGNTGTIFSFNPVTNTLTTLVSFNGVNGTWPNGPLTLGSNGLLYGTTKLGGTGQGISSSSGTIFSFNSATNTLTTLANFNGTNGAFPNGVLTPTSNGLFYGTTAVGGTDDVGTVFSFNPATNTLTTLANFLDPNNNHIVAGGLASTPGLDGLLYGLDSAPSGIYSFDPTTNTLNRHLASFSGYDAFYGPYPNSLTRGNNGLFYGTAQNGYTSGAIFSFNPATNALTTLVNFDYTSGYPNSLTLTSNGLFYGTTAVGGTGNAGTIFSFNPSTNVVTTLANFNFSSGSAPTALTLGSNGLFYGTTQEGGTNGWGTIFSFKPPSTSVPEPTSALSFFAFGALGLTSALNRKRKLGNS